MSAMTQARRKLLCGPKPGPRNYAKGDYMRWLKNAKAQIAGYFKLDEYLKHRVNQKALQRAINEEAALREWKRLMSEPGGGM